MLLEAVAFILILSCGVNADTKGRTDLRITGGICLQPHTDRCAGKNTRGEISDILYRSLGRTKPALESKGFTSLNNDCRNNGEFNGIRWVNPSANPLSHAVLLDVKGTVAGLQFMMPYKEIDLSVKPNYRFDKQPAIQNFTINGLDYFFITVYFMKPSSICTTGRDSSQLESEGTVSELYLQVGPSPSQVKKISLKSPPKTMDEQRLLQGWNENNCFRSMGWHRFYMQETWDSDNCGSFLPFFAMYTDEKDGGDLNGFGFVVPGKASSPAIERPSVGLIQWTAGSNNSTESVPKCLAQAHAALGISSMHVYLNPEPYKFICSNARGQSGLSNSQPKFKSENYSQNENENASPMVTIPKVINVLLDGLDLLLKSWTQQSYQQKKSSTSDLPICVVGAGFSGIGMALNLQELGYPVILYEKENRVGGKVKTHRQGSGSNEVQVDLCPLLISNVSDRIIGYMNKYGYHPASFDEKDRFGYDMDYMVPLPTPVPTKEQAVILNEQVLKYISIWQQIKSDLRYGYINVQHPDLYLPMSQWLEKQGLTALSPIITMLITTQGYGKLDDTPALYVVQLLDDYKMTSLTQPEQKAFFIVEEGLDKLVNSIATGVKNLKLNSRIKKIVRDSQLHQIIEFEDGEKQDCLKTVLAFPPLLSDVEKIVADLTEEEKSILSEIRVQKYVSSASIIPSWDRSMYIEAYKNNSGQVGLEVPRGVGEPTAFLKQSKEGKQQHVYSAYSWINGNFKTAANENDLEVINKTLRATLDKVDSQSPGQKSEILTIENPVYFPHVNTTSLQNGFYTKFVKNLNKKGMYYATPLLNFEIMERCLQMSEILSKVVDYDCKSGI